MFVPGGAAAVVFAHSDKEQAQPMQLALPSTARSAVIAVVSARSGPAAVMIEACQEEIAEAFHT